VGKLYSSPLRVYLCLGFLALVGIYCGLKLPISLFPNSSKPSIAVGISYGNSTADEFVNTYGHHIEDRFRELSTGHLEVEKVEADYDTQKVVYHINFRWGADPKEALKEVKLLIAAVSSQFTQEVRDSIWVWPQGDNQGFLAISFYSQKRTLDELYKYLEPLLASHYSEVKDSEELGLWNPTEKEIQIELDPERMAYLGLYPRDVAAAVYSALNGNGGGTVTIGINKLDVSMTRQLKSIEDISNVVIPTPGKKAVHLSDVAHVDLGVPITNSHSFKTSGAPSLIMWADPKPGGNIKKMAEDAIEIVKKLAVQFPEDIHYKILVDPSEFIRSAVSNVFREVVVAALLAVGVLFLFIGSFKNVVTAAIEIPLSIILAFILMRFAGINLNLISLGGLALSAGMNVDASVVVMENIFRHFEGVTGKLSFQDRLKIVTTAVKEVSFPIIASTIASIVVFIPLALTTGLSQSLLGDLALAVVFSHGFSAVVALILVPTIRLQIMSAGGRAHSDSPIEGLLKRLENFYVQNLAKFLKATKTKLLVYSSLAVILVALSLLVIPRLQKEIIGRPDTDWLVLNINTQGNTLIHQMESQTEEVEARLLKEYGTKIQYTFTQIQAPNYAQVMARLNDKKMMNEVWKSMEKSFVNTPTLFFNVWPWNPSELAIPNPPNFRIAIRGGLPEERAVLSQDFGDLLQEKRIFPNVQSVPNVGRRESIVFKPYIERWSELAKQGVVITASDLADVSRVATLGRQVGNLPVESRLVPVNILYPAHRVSALEDLASFPIGIQGKLVPLKSLVSLKIEKLPPLLHNVDGRGVDFVSGKVHEEDKAESPQKVKEAERLFTQWKEKAKFPEGVSVNLDDAQYEMNDALSELESAVGISILLIFLVMVLQFGNFMTAIIVMVSVPLGFIGVLVSLYIFKSTLSLNSVLGVILLNGIAVANSIILVDFLKKLVARGLSPKDAALEAAQKRLRPILMTSMTTALGMLPIALGLGEGGRILQPLGLAVVGGLGFSVFMTLFIVPSLQVSYLEWARKRKLEVVTVPANLGTNEN
jgi:hydrophobic/amphiphilic exporter-1 (mainly G- bacteria), HAE1 family